MKKFKYVFQCCGKYFVSNKSMTMVCPYCGQQIAYVTRPIIYNID